MIKYWSLSLSFSLSRTQHTHTHTHTHTFTHILSLSLSLSVSLSLWCVCVSVCYLLYYIQVYFDFRLSRLYFCQSINVRRNTYRYIRLPINLAIPICPYLFNLNHCLYHCLFIFYHFNSCKSGWCILTFHPAKFAIPKVVHRKEVTHSNGSYERKSRRWAWLTKWDKVKNPMVHS